MAVCPRRTSGYLLPLCIFTAAACAAPSEPAEPRAEPQTAAVEIETKPVPRPEVKPGPSPAPEPKPRPETTPETTPETRPGPKPATAPTPKPVAVSRPGTSRSVISGCLKTGQPTEEMVTRGVVMKGGEDSVQIETGATGLEIRHDLGHACCLEAKVVTSVKGQEVLVVENLTGEPCRCMCRSTITTSVSLKYGDYTLILEVNEIGQYRRVLEKPVTIP